MTHSQRRRRLCARLQAATLDAMLVSDLNNIHYLSGFTGSNAALLVYSDDRPAVLATDGLESRLAEVLTPGSNLRAADVVGTSCHGIEFTCAVQRANIFGTQFHPEKSLRHGLALMRAFAEVQPS